MSNSNSQSASTDATKIDFHNFIEKRAHEMEAMMQSSRAVKENQRIMQKLPRHMRRRAASHDVRRLPLALREAASREAKKSGNPRVSKRPSRRFRRRPRNLLLDYERRKRKHVWLETHIWHAKRFHMTERWGYKIPLHSNERGVRAAYRSSANTCLILDLSYYCCIQLTGPQAEILNHLNRLTSSSRDATTFASQMYLNGTKEGRCSLYRDGCYPKSVIGEVTFMWRPVSHSRSSKTVLSSSDTTAESEHSSTSQEVTNHSNNHAGGEKFCDRDLWIWAHPSSYTLIFNEIKSVCSMTTMAAVEYNESATSVSPCSRVARFTNGTLTLTSLKDELCRFKLVGPESLAVLQAALRLAKLEPSPCEAVKMDIDGGNGGPCKRVKYSVEPSESCSETKTPSWWEVCCRDEENVKVHREQTQLWSSMLSVLSPAELLPSSIYGLTVRDPRLFLPKKKLLNSDERGFGSVGSAEICRASSVPSACRSAIWCRSTREEVTRSKLSTSRINDLRSNYIVPGTEPELGALESRIPILLVQNPGVRSSTCGVISRPGQGCGFDLIIPAGWSTAFWISVIYRRAQPAGLTELHSVTFESGKLLSPESYPDSQAGEEMNVTAYRERYSKYCRMPPAKRCNHVKLGVVAPFHLPWKELVEQWQTRMSQGESVSSDAFYVLRDRQYLRELGNRISGGASKISHSRIVLKCSDTQEAPKRIHNSGRRIIVLKRPCMSNGQNSVSEINRCANITPDLKRGVGSAQDMFRNEPCLVPVFIKMLGKGAPSRFSMICIPDTEDICPTSITDRPTGPVEPRHRDNRKSKLKKKAKPKSETKDKPDSKVEISEVKKASAAEEKPLQTKLKVTRLKSVGKVPIEYAMLQLPVAEKVVDTSSRRVIGYVVEGGSSYAVGCQVALGFVSLQGLLTLLDEQKGRDDIRVLARSTSSYQYRWAVLSVNVEFSP